MVREDDQENPRPNGGGLTMELARAYCVPFGKYRGCTIAEVAWTDVGILWLQYASGLYYANGLFREALRVFLTDPKIARKLELLRLHRGC